jgi:hypothetical protein
MTYTLNERRGASNTKHESLGSGCSSRLMVQLSGELIVVLLHGSLKIVHGEFLQGDNLSIPSEMRG